MAKVGDLDVPLIPTMILVAGGYTAWFAVHYWRDTTQYYPSGPLKAVLTGKPLPAPIREDQTGEIKEVGGLINPGGSSTSGDQTGGGNVPKPGSASGVLSSAQIGTLWEQCGGDPAQTSFAVGVAEAESGGDPNATSYNDVGGGTNVGLYQLETPGGVGSGYSVAELQDPTQNTTITIMATKNGTDWSQWADPWISAHGTHGNQT
jgi:hypothetical protein